MTDKEKTIKKEEIYESILEKDSEEFRKLMMRFINNINEEIGDEIEKELIYRNKDSLPQA
jgi:DNA-binding FadR family transcriptional regulator